MPENNLISTTPGEDGLHITYCRICEALCGMVVSVENGLIRKISPDRENQHSKGHICVKGIALKDLVHDKDRVTTPLKRTGKPGSFEPVSWDEALTDIAARLTKSIKQHGRDSIAINSGNPPSMGWPSSIGGVLFQQALGFSRTYSPASEDISTPVLATELMYGTHSFIFPDLVECDHLLIFGSNPLVSHGSLLIAPRFKEDLDTIASRGRVIVVDPRKTETARKYEHISIVPDTDVWLIGAMLQTIIKEELTDKAFIESHCSGYAELCNMVDWITPEMAAEKCGVKATTILKMARDFAKTRRAAAMGRIGICRGRFSTLTNFFLNALNVVSGKFHTAGGVGWGHGGTATNEQAVAPVPSARHGAIPSRVRGLPSVWGAQSSLTFFEEMTTPGDGQIKSLIVIGANPVLSMPNGPQLPEGFAQLDLMVALDLYITETTKHADYILPVTSQLERDDINLFFMNHMVRPFAQYAHAAIPPVGESRVEFDILKDLAQRMDYGEKFGQLSPFDMADGALQASIEGQDGLSLERLKTTPHGIMIERGRWAFDFKKRIGHKDGNIHLSNDLISSEIARLKISSDRRPDTLRLINLRKLRSINSWMHNVDKLVRTDEPHLLINPKDAEQRGIAENEEAILVSEWGEIEVIVELTDEVRPGCVAYPHGWGHAAGWSRANSKSGGNLNQITPSAPEQAEQVSGMSFLEGFDVEVQKKQNRQS